MVRRVIAEAEVPAESICLEVTESALIDADVAAAALWDLKSAGVEIAIDDFGTGYSSLSRLHKFPLDYLKIDRSFVDGMMNRREDAIIVSSVLGLAHGLGIHTIAEGIEDQAQWDELAAAGCHFGQGWLWSPAIPLEQASELVARTGSLPKADKA
jgi:EAL domain-containing protein (putative c-di-GMP-specific phosphodiesterase class I)